ncbi:MAG: hypothetical protein A2Y89_02970 [Chloroflexi bacterium RBG_13_51_18]|nr:MAG: hypothetical protein A2Y89_02970 [Chloroflexi bacterium RBG_13_51_18]
MHVQQWILLAIMAVCGAAVIGSYIHGFSTHPGSAETLWGGVSGGLRTLNYVTMLLAVVGFFAFSYWLFFRINPEQVQIADRFGFWLFFIIFLVILIPSALWMPLTFSYQSHPSTGLWIGVRIVLALVGIGSLALLWAICAISPRETGIAYWFAVGGAAAFSVQTAVMDTFIWPAFFTV